MNTINIPLHPDNKIMYREGQHVKIAMHGNIKNIYTGVIRGFAIQGLLDFWIVELDKPNDLIWPYSCLTVQHIFLLPIASNERFLCEQIGEKE